MPEIIPSGPEVDLAAEVRCPSELCIRRAWFRSDARQLQLHNFNACVVCRERQGSTRKASLENGRMTTVFTCDMCCKN